MFVHRSNRSERLVDILVGVLGEPLRDPLAAEWIAVQSRGMERWLSLELARRLGVWAHPHFPFPRALFEAVCAAASPSDDAAPPGDAFRQESLVWSVAAILARRVDDPAFADLRRYLHAAEGELDQERLLQLAERLARLFDDYALYRAPLVKAWEAGDEGGWQAILWRDLVAQHGREHAQARAERCFDALRANALRPASLPERLHLFGVAALPPVHVELFQALPASVAVHFYMMSPCRQYWSLIRPERSIARRAAGLDAAEREALHLEQGNPLLASFGRLGRELSELLEASGASDGTERYERPDDSTLLGALQADILDLQDPHPGESGVPRRCIAEADGSIGIHSCHGPMREVQVLHDQLTDRLARDPTLRPRDIIVMAPDIESYAPVVEAVFGARGGHASIPYHVADRSVTALHEVVDASLAVMDVLGSRMGAGEVLDLLGFDPVRRRFEIEAEDLEACREWVAESGIRWGVDAAHRTEQGQPSFAENTWRFGLERLLLGYALPSAAGLFRGRLACDAVEGTQAALLGKLSHFAATLFDARQRLRAPRSLAAWQTDLGVALEQLLQPAPDAAFQLQAIREALALLASRAAAAGFDAALELRTLRGQLQKALGDVLSPRLGARGFLAGGVTFCQLTPMRSIPFRVVCLIGMDDEAFPRSERPLGFDEMARQRKLGDRCRRDDDRYLFLEALLSARERLLITYVGQGVQDNEVRPPSVVVAELLDAVRRGFSLPGQGADEGEAPLSAYEARLVVRHPLQPFSPRYFREHPAGHPDRALFSYAAHYCEGARALSLPGSLPRFVPAGRGAPAELPEQLPLEQLIGYVTHPCRTYLKEFLGLYLGRDAQPLEEREPIALDALERWTLGSGLLGQVGTGVALDGLLRRERARGQLPLGTPGQIAFEDELPRAQDLIDRAEALRGGPAHGPLVVELQLAGVRLTGALDSVFPGGRVVLQYSRLKGRSELGVWVQHLVLNCVHVGLPVGDARRCSHLIGRDDKNVPVTLSLPGLADAPEQLAALLGWVRYAREGRLPLFTRASREYAAARLGAKPSNHDAALLKARTQFEKAFGDGDDPYVKQLFASFDAVQSAPGPADFGSVALSVFGELLRVGQLQ